MKWILFEDDEPREQVRPPLGQRFVPAMGWTRCLAWRYTETIRFTAHSVDTHQRADHRD
jgi:hypothetical protein